MYRLLLPFTPLCVSRSLRGCEERLGIAAPGGKGSCCGGGGVASARCPGRSIVRITRGRLGRLCVEVVCPGGVSCTELRPRGGCELLYCGHCVAVLRCGEAVHVVDALDNAGGPRFPWDCGSGLRVVNTVEGARRCVALPKLRGALELLRSICGLAGAEIVDLVYPYLVVKLVSSSGLTYYLGAALKPFEASQPLLSSLCPSAAPPQRPGLCSAAAGGWAEPLTGERIFVEAEDVRVVGRGGVPRFLAAVKLRSAAYYPWRLRCGGDCFGGFLGDWGRVLLSFGLEGGPLGLAYRGAEVDVGAVQLACREGRLRVWASPQPIVAVEPVAGESCIPLVVISYGPGLLDSVEGTAALRLSRSWSPVWPPGLQLGAEEARGPEARLSPGGLRLRCLGGYCVAACGGWAAAGAELQVPLERALEGCSVLVCGPGGCGKGMEIRGEEVAAAALRLAVAAASEVSELVEDVAPYLLDARKLLNYASILDVLP